MSCCSNCGYNLPCAGLGEIPIQQVAALEDYVVAGSVVEWGGYIKLQDSDVSAGWDDSMEAAIKNALWNHGGFSMVDAGSVAGFFRRYISIRVTTRVDFAHLGNIETTIEGAIYAAGFRPDTQNFWVVSVPAQAANRPNVAQPNAGAGAKPSNGGSSSTSWPDLSSIFGNSSNSSGGQNPLDRFASWLNIGQTEAAVIGAMAVVAGILIVKKAL